MKFNSKSASISKHAIQIMQANPNMQSKHASWIMQANPNMQSKHENQNMRVKSCKQIQTCNQNIQVESCKQIQTCNQNIQVESWKQIQTCNNIMNSHYKHKTWSEHDPMHHDIHPSDMHNQNIAASNFFHPSYLNPSLLAAAITQDLCPQDAFLHRSNAPSDPSLDLIGILRNKKHENQYFFMKETFKTKTKSCINQKPCRQVSDFSRRRTCNGIELANAYDRINLQALNTTLIWTIFFQEALCLRSAISSSFARSCSWSSWKTIKSNS